MEELFLTPDDDLEQAIRRARQPVTVHLKSGIYRQKILIDADDVTVIGEDPQTTVITYDDYARKIHADGREFNTFRTYTLCVTGERVKLCNLTVENSNTDPRAAGQCVALSVNCKHFLAENVNLSSTQDTLFLYPFPDDLVIRYRDFLPRDQLYSEGASVHLFENCRIAGTVDFIFGCAEAYFRRCQIVSVHDGRDIGFVAAPAHSLKQEHGFCFTDCDFLSQGAKPATVYLARPWRDFGKSVFINCRAADHIAPALFDKWNDTERDKTARFAYCGLACDFAPAPVPWATPLSNRKANDIIQRCNAQFKAFNK